LYCGSFGLKAGGGVLLSAGAAASPALANQFSDIKACRHPRADMSSSHSIGHTGQGHLLLQCKGPPCCRCLLADIRPKHTCDDLCFDSRVQLLSGATDEDELSCACWLFTGDWRSPRKAIHVLICTVAYC
jgi:hypothetical protein